MEGKYIVTYMYDDEEANCKIMTGDQLAHLYGFSDCFGVKVLHVYKMLGDGHLFDCPFHGSWKAPFNRLYVNIGIGETVCYEWDEH